MYVPSSFASAMRELWGRERRKQLLSGTAHDGVTCRLRLPEEVSMASRLIVRSLLATCILTGCRADARLQAQQHSDADVSGAWIGSFDISNPDGSVRQDTAFFRLTQNGTTVTGTAGGTEHQQSPIAGGVVSGHELRFTMSVHGAPLNFNLDLEGDHLSGAVTEAMTEGGKHIAVDVVREKPEAGRMASGDKALFDEISRQDAALFQAFNQRDLKTLDSFFTKDLEFYHDKEGRTGYEKNMESFQRNFASEARVRRELVEGTLEVYPIAGYGAVELGIHRFYTSGKGQPEQLTATARFVHLWELKDGTWKISRVISYDHR